MTAIVHIAGVALAAGLVWIPAREATGRRYFAFRRARQLGARLYAERAHQIGFASVEDREGGAYRGLAAAADLVARAVAAPEGLSWQALVACQDERFLVVQGTGAEILPEGDRILTGEDAALHACAAKTDWDAQWATSGLLPGARELCFEPAAVRAADLARLRAAPFGGARASRRSIAVAALLIAALGTALVWLQSAGAPEPVREALAPNPPPEPVWVAEGVPPGDFVARCLEAQAAFPPVLPQMWRLKNIGCYADASDRHELSTLALEQGAMVATWSTVPEANRALARRIAERRLGAWPRGRVIDGEAWAAVRFESPVQSWDGEAPRAAEFRRAVDRALATVSDNLRFTYADEMTFEARTGLALAELGSRLEGIEWLDMREAVWLEGRWTVRGSLVRRRPLNVEEEEKG